MEQHGRLRSAGRARVVVGRNRMQELGAHVGLEGGGASFHEAQTEVNVAEEPTLLGRAKRRPLRELARAAKVVQQRGGEQEVGAQPWMQLRRLAADRGDSDRVLQQAAGVGMVRFRGRQAAQGGANRLVVEEAMHCRAQARVGDLGGEELEEALQLVRVAANGRGELRGIGAGRGFERSHVDLQPVAELLDAAEHADGVSFREARVEQLDVVPDAGVDPPARVDQLEGEVRGASLRAQPLLARDRVDPLDDPLFGELRDRVHGGSLTAVADVRPFRAERYDEAKAGPLENLVAPPYDVISPAQREEYLARSPYNVVHLTLPDDDAKAAYDLAWWRAERVLVRDEQPSFWFLSQDYTGPDGVARQRNGLVASLRVEPYDRGVVLPHERTHSGPKEGRLRLLRATNTQLEPIFLLYEGDPLTIPDVEPELESGGDRLWRSDAAPSFADTELLIADGHHRYETALAYAAEGGSPYLMVVLVPTRQEGLTIFPTHRVAQRVNGARGTPIDEPGAELPGVVLYRDGHYELLESDGLDVDVVERLAPQGVTYTPQREEAVATVDRGEAEAAFLLRPTRIEDVWAVARRGETLPQKSTYFFPKLTSGLLFDPLD